MFERVFKNIDDTLRKDAGCSSELDYVEQTSWIIFLKYISDLEKDRETVAQLRGEEYTPVIDERFWWNNWAAPKDENGNINHNTALSGDDLLEFVNNELFPYFKTFKLSAQSPDTIEYKIGEIFHELKNRIQSGYNLREVLNLVDELKFSSKHEQHEMSHLYESRIAKMGNAGRNGGEYYTPRSLIRTIIKVLDPQIGEKVYDGAVGSGGFLTEAFEYMRGDELSSSEWRILQESTFYGKEKKALAYIISIMNLILHGLESPNIKHTNTLSENLADVEEKDRFDVILANPPFGGNERPEIQQNFPIKTSETASLFLQHFIKLLKVNGRAGIVIKNTFLSNTDRASVSLRKMLLESCNLHSILDLPQGTFTGAGVKTVVLFFEKGVPTRDIWYYQLNLGRNLGKTNPLSEKDLEEFATLYKNREESENSWIVPLIDVDEETYDLSVKNPHIKEEAPLRAPSEIIEEMHLLDSRSSELLEEIKRIL